MTDTTDDVNSPAPCRGCGKTFPLDELTELPDGWYCGDCTSPCHGCGRTFANHDLERGLCEACRPTDPMPRYAGEVPGWMLR